MSGRTEFRKRWMSVRTLWWLGAILVLLSMCILQASTHFAYDVPQPERPLLTVFVLWTASGVCYLLALSVAVRLHDRDSLPAVITCAVVLRLVMLGSVPIQEVDIYRYLWDGLASSAGVSPFAHTPANVLEANHEATGTLAQLVKVRDSSPHASTILTRVHFGELPTVYPPVSQAVFSLATWTTPSRATVLSQVVWMKCWIVAFDLGTVAIVGWLLRFTRLPVGWLVAYAWCPLVLKEFANSGHLDAIAICCTTAALAATARACFRPHPSGNSRDAVLAAVFLSLGIGAKLYPIVLAPMCLWTVGKRLSWRVAGACLAVGTLLIGLFALPLWPERPNADMTAQTFQDSQQPSDDDPFRTLDPLTSAAEVAPTKTAGFEAFFSRWMMNDLIFLNLIENITPDALRHGTAPWFVFVPDAFRSAIVRSISGHTGAAEASLPFAIARTITAALFAFLCIAWAGKATRQTTAAAWLEYAFLTLAWFWLLLPTLNPWYWLWALPLLPFARGRAWVLLSVLLFLYYLRFYFAGHFADRPVLSILPYHGMAFFDYVVVWLEYGPWFAILAWAWWQRRTTVATPS